MRRKIILISTNSERLIETKRLISQLVEIAQIPNEHIYVTLFTNNGNEASVLSGYGIHIRNQKSFDQLPDSEKMLNQLLLAQHLHSNTHAFLFLDGNVNWTLDNVLALYDNSSTYSCVSALFFGSTGLENYFDIKTRYEVISVDGINHFSGKELVSHYPHWRGFYITTSALLKLKNMEVNSSLAQDFICEQFVKNEVSKCKILTSCVNEVV